MIFFSFDRLRFIVCSVFQEPPEKEPSKELDTTDVVNPPSPINEARAATYFCYLLSCGVVWVLEIGCVFLLSPRGVFHNWNRGAHSDVCGPLTTVVLFCSRGRHRRGQRKTRKTRMS